MGKNNLKEGVVVELKNINKFFKINHESQNNSLKSFFLDPMSAFKRNYQTEFHALKNINLTINKGESVGIIGSNGSGKSTTLKIIAGIYSPDGGKVLTRGKVVPFLELGVGFNPDLTARENVFLNGTILGMTRDEIKRKFDSIVDFAEVRDFLDTPIKNFSSGMLVRLAFSIAIQAEGDVYILDEILSVGDVKFQEKSRKEFEKLRMSGKTLIFVSHSMASIKEFCNRAVCIKNGEMFEKPTMEETINFYLEG
ncbi:MAG: ABC transporter ATP-binding protein [bacterium]